MCRQRLRFQHDIRKLAFLATDSKAADSPDHHCIWNRQKHKYGSETLHVCIFVRMEITWVEQCSHQWSSADVEPKTESSCIFVRWIGLYIICKQLAKVFQCICMWGLSCLICNLLVLLDDNKDHKTNQSIQIDCHGSPLESNWAGGDVHGGDPIDLEETDGELLNIGQNLADAEQELFHDIKLERPQYAAQQGDASRFEQLFGYDLLGREVASTSEESAAVSEGIDLHHAVPPFSITGQMQQRQALERDDLLELEKAAMASLKKMRTTKNPPSSTPGAGLGDLLELQKAALANMGNTHGVSASTLPQHENEGQLLELQKAALANMESITIGPSLPSNAGSDFVDLRKVALSCSFSVPAHRQSVGGDLSELQKAALSNMRNILDLSSQSQVLVATSPLCQTHQQDLSELQKVALANMCSIPKQLTPDHLLNGGDLLELQKAALANMKALAKSVPEEVTFAKTMGRVSVSTQEAQVEEGLLGLQRVALANMRAGGWAGGEVVPPTKESKLSLPQKKSHDLEVTDVVESSRLKFKDVRIRRRMISQCTVCGTSSSSSSFNSDPATASAEHLHCVLTPEEHALQFSEDNITGEDQFCSYYKSKLGNALNLESMNLRCAADENARTITQVDETVGNVSEACLPVEDLEALPACSCPQNVGAVPLQVTRNGPITTAADDSNFFFDRRNRLEADQTEVEERRKWIEELLDELEKIEIARREAHRDFELQIKRNEQLIVELQQLETGDSLPGGATSDCLCIASKGREEHSCLCQHIYVELSDDGKNEEDCAHLYEAQDFGNACVNSHTWMVATADEQLLHDMHHMESKAHEELQNIAVAERRVVQGLHAALSSVFVVSKAMAVSDMDLEQSLPKVELGSARSFVVDPAEIERAPKANSLNRVAPSSGPDALWKHLAHFQPRQRQLLEADTHELSAETAELQADLELRTKDLQAQLKQRTTEISDLHDQIDQLQMALFKERENKNSLSEKAVESSASPPTLTLEQRTNEIRKLQEQMDQLLTALVQERLKSRKALANSVLARDTFVDLNELLVTLAVKDGKIKELLATLSDKDEKVEELSAILAARDEKMKEHKEAEKYHINELLAKLAAKDEKIKQLQEATGQQEAIWQAEKQHIVKCYDECESRLLSKEEEAIELTDELAKLRFSLYPKFCDGVSAVKGLTDASNFTSRQVKADSRELLDLRCEVLSLQDCLEIKTKALRTMQKELARSYNIVTELRNQIRALQESEQISHNKEQELQIRSGTMQINGHKYKGLVTKRQRLSYEIDEAQPRQGLKLDLVEKLRTKEEQVKWLENERAAMSKKIDDLEARCKILQEMEDLQREASDGMKEQAIKELEGELERNAQIIKKMQARCIEYEVRAIQAETQSKRESSDYQLLVGGITPDSSKHTSSVGVPSLEESEIREESVVKAANNARTALLVDDKWEEAYQTKLVAKLLKEKEAITADHDRLQLELVSYREKMEKKDQELVHLQENIKTQRKRQCPSPPSKYDPTSESKEPGDELNSVLVSFIRKTKKPMADTFVASSNLINGHSQHSEESILKEQLREQWKLQKVMEERLNAMMAYITDRVEEFEQRSVSDAMSDASLAPTAELNHLHLEARLIKLQLEQQLQVLRGTLSASSHHLEGDNQQIEGITADREGHITDPNRKGCDVRSLRKQNIKLMVEKLALEDSAQTLQEKTSRLLNKLTTMRSELGQSVSVSEFSED